MTTTTQHVPQSRCQILALPTAPFSPNAIADLRRDAREAGCAFVSSLALAMARAARTKATANTTGDDGPEAA
ncbi:hypothetical protein [Pseudomonas oryzihabitans]|uniref:hypothetical protein n=1 Tax=Pseudomonas oryzihabitans TaxID=47885 RepID=UPI002895E9A0|nr:hypothetical protein [Pseudomonas oryzihabitans]MDT3720328.1 hypothetical protein [Pseudomonas oryzihabitans]